MATDGGLLSLITIHVLLVFTCLEVPVVFSAFLPSQVLEARQLFPYRGYRDVQVFYYSVPSLVSKAIWEFNANGSLHCSSQPVSVYLQHGSYPVIDLDNSSFPDQFVVHRQLLHHLKLETDVAPVTLNISSPIPGDWYAVAFLEMATDRIVQKGLYLPCKAWLHSKVEFNIEEVETLQLGSQLQQQIPSSRYYRFFASSNTWSVRITITSCAGVPHVTDVECPIVLYVRPRALPMCNISGCMRTNLINCSTEYSQLGCSVTMTPAEEDWNYIFVEVSNGTEMEFVLEAEAAVCETPGKDAVQVISNTMGSLTNLVRHQGKSRKVKNSNFNLLPSPPTTTWSYAADFTTDLATVSLSCWPRVPFVRTTLPGNFAFLFDLPPDKNNTIPLFLNLTTKSPTLASFDILPVLDIGGTLVLELALSPSINTTMTNLSVEVCLEYGLRPSLAENGSCASGKMVSVNTSSIANRLGTLYIPYPESGRWYLSLYPHCYFQENEGNESEVIVMPCDPEQVPFLLVVKSASCMMGQCGQYGRCYQYISGGFIFSTCVCIAGWKGWGCTDGSSASSQGQLLLSVLLLTLSNLLFIPAIVLAVYRHYYTEAMVYLTTMFFSTFYHACDIDVFSFCLMRLSLLQFCDFYSSILAFWVTLIAMADLSSTLQSLAHVAGAVGIAIGSEYDRTGLWVFVVPAATGLIILISSWVMHCYGQRSCYPRKRIWLLCLLPGMLLASTGLILFALLETYENYAYVHSGWHATMALCILFLLPERRHRKDNGTSHLFEDRGGYVHAHSSHLLD